ncbi:MAG: hypothetical protein NVSMB29_08510 [Candidatus Dormibacteria bacterium]
MDDDPALRTIYDLALSFQGFEVTLASDGREAVGALREPVSEVVLTDLEMPGMDGLDLCWALRSRAETARVPVLILTGSEFTSEARLRAALELQPLAIHRKPTPLRSLGRLLEAVIELGRVRERHSEPAEPDQVAGAARSAGGADRLLPGEDLATTDPRAVERWLGTYLDLLEFKTSLIDQTRRRYASAGSAPRSELEHSDLPFLESEAARFHRRIAAWQRRRAEVAGRTG